MRVNKSGNAEQQQKMKINEEEWKKNKQRKRTMQSKVHKL